MIGHSFKASLKKRVVGTLLILVVAIFLGLLTTIQLFISKNPSTKFLVDSTWCSILTRDAIWMFDDNESFTQRTLFFNEYSGSEKVWESGSWNLITTQNGDGQLRIPWDELHSREEVKQYFLIRTNEKNLLSAKGDFYGFGEEEYKIFYRCNDPR